MSAVVVPPVAPGLTPFARATDGSNARLGKRAPPAIRAAARASTTRARAACPPGLSRTALASSWSRAGSAKSRHQVASRRDAVGADDADGAVCAVDAVDAPWA